MSMDAPQPQEGPDEGRRTGPPPAPQDQRPAAGPVGAGLGRRIGARLLDVLIVALPLTIILSLVGFGAGAVFNVGDVQGQWISSLLYSALWFGYFVILESNRGATVGKQLVGIRVRDEQGGNPAPAKAAQRNVWMLLGLIPVLGSFLWFVAVIAIIVTIATGSDMQGWHDRWAGTWVLRT